MKIDGKHELDIDRQSVWNGLNDHELLARCIPGCEKLERTGENEYSIIVTARIGPIKTRFNGSISMTDIQEPKSYKLVFSGSGGSAGSAKGETSINLVESDNKKTVLEYHSSVAVTGKLAQIGTKLVDSAARSYADQFFSSFTNVLSPSDERSDSAGTETGNSNAISVLNLVDRKYKFLFIIVVIILAVILAAIII